ncbi:MAG TPA: hypothetical protein VH641_03945 [Streptosporangiaceae bacterium]|jgi:hypothetical protein
MSRDSDWAAAIRAVGLPPGEPLLALIPATTPAGLSRGLAPAELMPLVIAAERIAWRRRTGAAGLASLFPLAPRMVIGLTGQRLLVWAARSRWRTGKYLGEVSRDRIVSATAPTAGTGWRTVLIHLASEPAVTIKVPAVSADRLAATLSGQADMNVTTQESI